MFKITIFVVFCTIIAAGLAKSTMDGPEIIAARREFKRCYDDIIHYIKTGNSTNTICRDKADFKNKIDEYAETELRVNGRKLPRNEFYIKFTLFSFSHRYSKEYFLMMEEGKDCFALKDSKRTSPVNKKTSNTDEPPKSNLIKQIFSRDSSLSYTEHACDTLRLKKERLEHEMPADCNEYTRRFFIDMCDEFLEDCRKYNVINVNRIEPRVIETTSWLSLTTAMSLVIVALIIIVFVAFIGLILTLRHCCIYSKYDKNATELPKKANVP